MRELQPLRAWIGRVGHIALLFLVATSGLWAQGTDYKIDQELMRVLSEDAEAAAPFFVVFGERANVKPATRIGDRAARGRFVVQSLQATANSSQAGVRSYLQSQRVAFTPFWVENKIYVPQGTLQLARELARRPEVVAILPEQIYTIPQPQGGGEIQVVGWNIAKIRADQVWPTTRGAGTVVANIDTGVQFTHPALVNQYRGNVGGFAFTHAGNWRDPTGACGSAPCDNNGHGTHTMGTMVGDDGAGNQIGVAPGAKWIACKGCLNNSCFSSHLITCAQWILDPLQNGTGANQPDVVNNSWGGGNGDPWYQSYVQNWRAAGVFPAFAAGNDGPACSTVISPGDYPESFASGATSSTDAIASFSSRGPSAFGGIKPNVSAPGVSVRSSVPTNSYAYFSGTSMANPHTAGTVALLWAAATSYLGNISGTEQILKDSAVKLITAETCGGLSAGVTPNNTYGWGRIDAKAAVDLAGGGPPLNQSPTVTINSPGNGSSFNCPATVNFAGSASDPEQGDLSGSISWTDNGTGFGTGANVSKPYACTDAGSHVIIASANDSGGLSDMDTITITIVDPNLPSAPQNLTATVNGSTVNLSWNDVTNEDGYYVERKKNGGSWSRVDTKGPNVTSDSDSPGKGNWSYRVQAFKGSSTSPSYVSPYSNIATAHVR
ncbi:MAG: S8 family serine peptidase [Acidobacteria bacterium]|nr:S8 family serine peptidase [Acidobacteriota bacterium]